jgi:hypothetical protein
LDVNLEIILSATIVFILVGHNICYTSFVVVFNARNTCFSLNVDELVVSAKC